jgi:hypothetical protein
MLARRLIHPLAAVCALLITAAPAGALVNPRVQPHYLYNLHHAVLAARVVKVDKATLTIELQVKEVVKGKFAPTVFTLTAPDRTLLEAVLAVEQDQVVVAYIGAARDKGDVLYYVGGGQWYKARIADLEKPASWTLTGNADEGKAASSDDIMFGVFNGTTDTLAMMMQDAAAGRYYFPPVPFTRFEARSLVQLEKPARGVGLGDVNRDGRLDVVLASPGGCRVLEQQADGAFVDRSEAWGIAAVAANSVSLADVDADGALDVLLDATVYRQRAGRWTRTDLLPAVSKVHSAAFVELNGDGYPDVVVSVVGGGLRAFANPLKAGGGEQASFGEITGELKLDQDDRGAGGTGYFDAGDFNADGRSDLLYLAGPGYLLLGSAEGFAPTPLADAGDEPEYGTAALGAIAASDTPGAIVLAGEGKRLLSASGSAFADVTRYGNELQDEVAGLSMVIAEDLNADGTIDLLAVGPQRGTPAFLCTNRGYGSFIIEDKYAPGQVLPTEANRPAYGLAAGDVNGDGAVDVVHVGADGAVTLLVNRTFENRPTNPRPEQRAQLEKQTAARSFTVRFARNQGIVGASLVLQDAQGRTIARRTIGSNIGIGCSGPHEVTFVVREPGPCKLSVRYADGLQTITDIPVPADPRHRVLLIDATPQGSVATP